MSCVDNDGLRTRSGNMFYKSRLISFLYDLLRDHLVPSTVEKLVSDAHPDVYYTNGYLARYAADVAERLMHNPNVVRTIEGEVGYSLGHVIHTLDECVPLSGLADVLGPLQGKRVRMYVIIEELP